MRADEALVDVGGGDAALGIDAHLDGEREAIFARDEARGAAGEDLGEHRDDAAGEVDAGAAEARFVVDRRVFCDEGVDVRDGDEDAERAVGAGGEHGERVVDVACGGGVDGDRGDVAEVAARALARLGSGLGGGLFDLRLEDGAEAVARDAALDREVGVGVHDAHGDEGRPADRGDQIRALREAGGGGFVEGPVGVCDEAIDAEVRLATAHGDAAEELGAGARDEREIRRGEAASVGGRDARADDVAVEEGVEIRRGDERGGLLGALDREEAEAAGMDGHTTANRGGHGAAIPHPALGNRCVGGMQRRVAGMRTCASNGTSGKAT